MAPIIAAIFEAPDVEGLANVYDSMNPDYYDHFTRTTLEMARQYNRSMQDRMREARLVRSAGRQGAAAALNGRKRILLAFNGPEAALPELVRPERDEKNKYGLWLDGFGLNGDQSSGGMFDGFEYDIHGVAIGYDKKLNHRLLLGASVGYSRTVLDVNNLTGAGDIDTIHASLYGSYFTDDSYADAILAYGYQTYDNARLTQVLSTPYVATSEHEGHLWSAYGEIGANHQFGQWTLQPFAAMNYIYLDESAFNESGADPLNLGLKSRSTNSLVSDAGMRFSKSQEFAAVVLTSELGASWNYDYRVDGRDLSAGFSGYPGATFTIKGRESEPHGFVLGGGLTFSNDGGWNTSLKYRDEFRNGYRNTGLMGELRYEF